MSFGTLVNLHKKRVLSESAVTAESASESVPVRTAVTLQAIAKFLCDNQGREDDGMLHASEAKGYCPREAVLWHWLTESGVPFETVKRSFPTQLLATFEIGTALHHHYQNRILGPAQLLMGLWGCTHCDALHSERWSVMPTTPCRTCGHLKWHFREAKGVDLGLRLSGSIDGGVLVGARMFGLELKTISQSGFEALRGVLPEQQVQADIYCHLFKLPGMVFLYLSKGFHKGERLARVGDGYELGPYKEFIHTARPETIAAIKSGREIEAKALESGQLPSRLTACKAAHAARARDCRVCALCFADDDGGEVWGGEAALK